MRKKRTLFALGLLSLSLLLSACAPAQPAPSASPAAVTAPTPAASPEESEVVLRWLETPGVRLIEIDGEWSCPLDGAAKHLTALSLPDPLPTDGQFKESKLPQLATRPPS